MSELADQTALQVMETVPIVMRVMRLEMRRHRQLGLSLVQFRTLAFIHGQPGASLNELAEHLGLSAASCSKLVDILVGRGLVQRREADADRRKICLELTEQGGVVWEEAFKQTQAAMAKRLSELTVEEKEKVKGAMEILKPMFEEGRE